MWSLLSCVLICPQSVDGLRDGERCVELARAPQSGVAATARRAEFAPIAGRVIDAFSGYPVADAKIETWTEEIDANFGGFHRIGEARSGVDGQFVVARFEGSCSAEKARIAAHGYATWSGTAGDLFQPVPLFPADAAEPAVQIRVVDTGDRPIPGARFTSTYSCAHDLPAFEVATGVDGIARLTEFGIQDHGIELRLRAPGYLAIKYLSVDAFARVAGAAPLTVVLPRCEPFAFRVLERDGEPLVNAPLYVLEGDSYHVVRTEADGTARFPWRYGDGEISAYVLATEQNRYVGSFTPAAHGRMVSLRVGTEDWPADTPTGTVRFEPASGGEFDVDLNIDVMHEAGWATIGKAEGDGTESSVEFPVGKCCAVVGGPFSGVRHELHDFELVAERDSVVRVQAVAEPRIRLDIAEPGYSIAWIEAGRSSRVDPPLGEAFPVPAGCGLSIGVRAPGGGISVHSMAPVEDGVVVDLTGALRPGPRPAVDLAAQRVSVVAMPAAGPLSDVRVGVECSGDVDVRPLADGAGYEFDGARGSAWLLRCAAPGHVQVWRRGRFGVGPHAGEAVECRLPAIAKLRLAAPFAFEVAGGEHGAVDLEDLTPGPLELVIERDDGRRYGLSLRIEPGDDRAIVWRE